ncbi:MAG: CcoQ/FixQ family Cbb3-type cytochrome c oxidase assembly chaperone [Bdellovibrionota bacterium]
MYRELLVRFPLIDLVLVGQLIFFAIFCGALGWIFRKGSKEFYETLANQPLEKGEDSRE